MPIYRAIYDGPPRGYTATRTTKRYIAIHNTSNDASAEDEASYAKRRPDSVSSHYYVDSNSIIQSLDTHFRAWHAGNREGNDHAISYEITGVNTWSRAQWLDRVAWNLLAAQIRKDCAAHNIVPRDLTVAQIKTGSLTGLITHNDMRLAWGGTTHTDPGPNFPMDHLIALIKKEEDHVDKNDVNQVWNTDGVVAAPEGYDAEKNPHWTAANVLRSAHLYSRLSFIQAREAKAGVKAVLAAVGGLDTEAILNAIEQRAAEDLERDEALLELVEQGQSGALDAAEVVRLIGEKLTTGTEPTPA